MKIRYGCILSYSQIKHRLAALPELERRQVEAMVSELMQIEGVGRGTALEIIWAAGRLILGK